MKDYEMVMILDPGLDTTSLEEKTKSLRDKLTNFDGVIQSVTPWGKRKLAYDIAKKDAGYYVVFNFQIPSQGLLDFKENIRHDTEILRYLIVVNRQPLAPITSDTAEEGTDRGRTFVEMKEPEAEEKVEDLQEDDDEDYMNEEEK